MSNPETRPSIEGVLTEIEPVSIIQLGINVDRKLSAISHNTYYDEVLSTGDRASTEPIYPYQLQHPDGSTEYIMVCPPIYGSELADFLFMGAPSKKYGRDVEDLLFDWHDLFGKPEHIDRLARHAKIPHWDTFAAHKDYLYEYIRDAHIDPNVDCLPLTPVIRIANDNGEARWMYDDIDSAVEENIRTRVGPIQAEEIFMPVLGPLWVAAFSPEVTEVAWGSRMNYDLSKAKGEDGQDMGVAQVLPLTLARAPDLFESDLLKALFAHIGQV